MKGREEYILNNSVILPMDTESITWEELFTEIEANDEHCQEVASNLAKLSPRPDWFRCSHHTNVKYWGAAGACPLCFLKTTLEEKQRIEYDIRTSDYEDFVEELKASWTKKLGDWND